MIIPSHENFGLIELEWAAGSRRMGRDLRVGVISPYRCRVFGNSRSEQSSSFSDVVALSATVPDPAARVSPPTLAAWNVRAVLDNPRSNRPERRTVLLARELAHCNVDIVALSETRSPKQGQLEEVGVGYTFFWVGRPKAEQHDACGTFIIRNGIVGRLPCLPQDINDRPMRLRLHLRVFKFVTIISAYSPTPKEAKNKLYEDLNVLLASGPEADRTGLSLATSTFALGQSIVPGRECSVRMVLAAATTAVSLYKPA
nr:unnamed protein product [Spirometra erinaceieuropaei]